MRALIPFCVAVLPALASVGVSAAEVWHATMQALGLLGPSFVIAASTLVSEDLACVGAGIAAARGAISLPAAVIASFAGIYVGDLLLFAAGRWVGRSALERAPLKWFLRREDVERCSDWLRQRGPLVIALSRLVPGTRLPTYFAAGALDTSFLSFAFYFLVAAGVWTPLLVGLSALLGGEVLLPLLTTGRNALVGVVVASAVLYVTVRCGVTVSTHEGRRRTLGRWRRLARWEFWPPWAFYPPVVCYIALLAVRYRSLTVFTAANPAIQDGGFVGESKFAILRGLAGRPDLVARTAFVDGHATDAERRALVGSFMEKHGLTVPIVLKPNVGQRGEGVRIAKSVADIDEYLHAYKGDLLVQEYVPGAEFGVFYYRFPEEPHGTVFSVTEKRFPALLGDGRRSLRRLVYDDERAVCMARVYLDGLGPRALEIPDAGERVPLVEIGSHCRGAVFLDGKGVLTPELVRAVDEAARGFEGFHFGRFDVRVPSSDEFARGRGFKIVELNGVTSEATHIYDPDTRLLEAYRVVFEQWRIAFAIGAANRARGVRVTPLRDLVRRIGEFLERG